MRVRMKVSISGARDGQSWPPIGGEVDLPDQEGADMCAAGMAVPVAVEAPVEKAVEPEPETRDEDKPKRRGRPPLPRDENGDIKRD